MSVRLELLLLLLQVEVVVVTVLSALVITLRIYARLGQVANSEGLQK